MSNSTHRKSYELFKKFILVPIRFSRIVVGDESFTSRYSSKTAPFINFKIEYRNRINSHNHFFTVLARSVIADQAEKPCILFCPIIIAPEPVCAYCNNSEFRTFSSYCSLDGANVCDNSSKYTNITITTYSNESLSLFNINPF